MSGATRRPGADFLWGAATSAYQTEGNNVNTDWWRIETQMPGAELSGDAVDSYHRYEEDMRLLADAGLTAYRFSIEWARIEPRAGHFSRAELAHYRRMIDSAVSLGLEPIVTLQHFSVPLWFSEQGGWMSDDAVDRFVAYVEEASTILGGVRWVITINEPSFLALSTMMQNDIAASASPEQVVSEQSGRHTLPSPRLEFAERLIAVHHAARDALRRILPNASVGWTIASQALTPTPGNEEKLTEVRYLWEDVYLDASRDDDFVGVQSYTSQPVDAYGLVPHPPHPDNTLTGWAYRPDALGIAVRQAWDRTGGVPILVTENGIASKDDERRIAYTSDALSHLLAAMEDGVDVRGYLHWSALDNYEWGDWNATFGLIAVDRETFARTPKPSLAWLGRVAATSGAEIPLPAASTRA
jgi:beta-glucosidase